MNRPADPGATIDSWRTNSRVTSYLVEHLPAELCRGQIAMLARQLDHKLSIEVTNGLWQFTTRLREIRGARNKCVT